MKDLLTYIAQNLVEHPQAVDVRETETDAHHCPGASGGPQ